MRNHVIALLLILFFANTGFAQQAIVSREKPLNFSRKDCINLSIYDWPRTLLSYPIYFPEGIQSESELNLSDNKQNRSVPFQLSDKVIEKGKLKSAVINFFAELPSGGEFNYTLYLRKNNASRQSSPVTLQKQASTWLISDGSFGVEIPAGGINPGHTIPAPIISILNDHQKIGNNKLHTGQRTVKEIKTSVLESGDLFIECGIHYILDNQASYYAKVKVIQGYPFVILDEQMENISNQDEVFIDMEWDNFHPTRRYGNWDRQKEVSVDGGLPIDQPIYTNWSQEDPHWTGMGWIEEPDKQMLYRLLPFGGNSTREQVPAISFWETQDAARELGVFVYDHNRWDDQQYGIWQPTPDLSVYFRYAGQKLYFKYPLHSGSRSTAITLYTIEKKQDIVDKFNKSIDEIAVKGGADHSDEMGFRYAMLLHRQYALLNLNKVKDWILEYPAHAKHPDTPFTGKTGSPTAEQFYQQIITSPMAYYMTGLNGFPGIHSISHRPLFGSWIEDYLALYKQLTTEQKQTVDGLMLISAYINTLEAMNTIRTSLAGTANMAADGWAVPGQMSFLYPEHPMAKEWADFFEKTLEIYGIFYTRPEVKAFESKGGRWVESLGIYNWAFLRPTSATNIALKEFDGKNRFAGKYMAQRGHWMLDMMTAPIQYKEKIERSYPPHGAHGGGRIVPRYCSVYQLADWMQYYDPLLAENLYWTGKMGPGVETKDTHTNWGNVHQKQYPSHNMGTNPHLRSTKYTGHGIVLRAGVDTDEELSIHLNQVDKGPNYRWGHQGQGNSGGLYFYAKGKIYTGHENEVVGDHVQNNLDGITNFGVMKNGAFCNIGMNELVAPLYDLDIVQLAELRSAKGEDSFAWPEYLSRSILLVGTDYFLLYDQTGTNWRAGARFSWFVQKEDEFPQIVFFGKKARPDHWTKGETNHSKGFYRDADGSLLTLVSHKKGDINVLHGKVVNPALLAHTSIYEFVPKSQNEPSNLLYIKAPHSTDVIFRDGTGISHQSEKESFTGEAGVIRRMDNGTLQLALMKGTLLSADGFSIELSDAGTAIAMTRTNANSCKGRYKSDGKARLTLKGMSGGKLYIDGIAQQGTSNISLPVGEHHIEYAREVTPMPTDIIDTEYTPNGTLIYLDIPASAKKVKIETSRDNGQTWTEVGTTTRSVYKLAPQPAGKIHVRALSVNGKHTAVFAQEYPVYTTNQAPHYPEGLHLNLDKGKVDLSWGKVLGAQKYRIYRRKAGDKDFTLIFEGKANQYTDMEAAGVIKACRFPGKLDNPTLDAGSFTVYEYTVTTVNGYGESVQSPIADTHPASWANWYPDTELKYKRTSAFWMEPYVPSFMTPEKYYPN